MTNKGRPTPPRSHRAGHESPPPRVGEGDGGRGPRPSPYATPLVKEYVRYGASPRAAQAIVLAAKIHALTTGHAYVSVDDVRAVALPALRHRILLNFEGQAGDVSTDAIVQTLLTTVPTE